MTVSELPFPPLFLSYDDREKMTIGCKDCESLPKVANAGEVEVVAGEEIQTMHNGIKIVAGGYGGAVMTNIIKGLRGHHEPQEELVFHYVLPLLGENPTMIELGANWGFYTQWFLKEAKGAGRAFMIEPDPYNIKVGMRNAELNNTSNSIGFVQGFCSSEDAEKVPFQTEHSGIVETRSINVNSFINENNIDVLDILHMDIQGAELIVLETLEDFLKQKKVRFAFVSTHHRSFSRDPLMHQRCLHFLKECGAQILVEHDVEESFSADGLILAYFGNEPIEWPDLKMSRNRHSSTLYRAPAYELSDAFKKIDHLTWELQNAKIKIEQLEKKIADSTN